MKRDKHAILAPSNKRWPKCPGSVIAESFYPDIPGEAAIEGTGAHVLLETCLLTNTCAKKHNGKLIGVNHPDKPQGWNVTVEMIERVQQCLDYITRRKVELYNEYFFTCKKIQTISVTVTPESSSDPGRHVGRTEWYGTVDITIKVFVNGVLIFLEIIDYKNGRIYVDAEDNSQLISYAAGKLELNQDKMSCRLTIVQPKTNPVVRYVDTTSDKIIVEMLALNDAAALTDDPKAPMISGKHCRWCKHREKCTATIKKSVKRISNMIHMEKGGENLFELLQKASIAIEPMSAHDLCSLIDAREGILSLFDKAESVIKNRLFKGLPVPGYAMLPGGSKKNWSKEEENIVTMLRSRKLKQSDIFPSKLITPAQVLKLTSLTKQQKEKIERDFIIKVPGNEVLTRVRDEPQEEKTRVFGDISEEVSFI